MAQDIKIEVIQNVVEIDTTTNVVEVKPNVNTINIHNADGLNGITPHIGANGNWFIGTKDTGVHAQGERGLDGEDGANGLTPYIGANGNWWIGETDTQIQAQGEQGIQGVQGLQGEKGDKGDKGDNGVDGTNGKSAYEQAVDGGFVGTEQEFTDALNNLNEIKNIMPLVYAGL
jgi:hypothetical protein